MKPHTNQELTKLTHSESAIGPTYHVKTQMTSIIYIYIYIDTPLKNVFNLQKTKGVYQNPYLLKIYI